MNDIEERYDMRTAAAWLLGHARNSGIPVLPEPLGIKKANECTEEELRQIIAAGLDEGQKLYPFKKGTQTLQRTKRTLGFLHSIAFETLLDVGSGRGVFLIPFMKEFPWVRVTGLDLLEKRVTFLNELADGGFPQLRAEQKDICSQPFPDASFDVVTMLEVLEHIPDVEKAIFAAVKMAKQYVVVTVPSKPDSNPEHIHLLTKEKLTRMFSAAGCARLHFDGVEGHLFLVAAKD
ncbi:MAG: class I SAM-dependent methyltransferase [Clostridia bacterium]|nr:class I SAM-dependent methyltransferase [Clostridia bacterium]